MKYLLRCYDGPFPFLSTEVGPRVRAGVGDQLETQFACSLEGSRAEVLA